MMRGRPPAGNVRDNTKVHDRSTTARPRRDPGYAEANNPDAKMNGARGFILAHTSPTAQKESYRERGPRNRRDLGGICHSDSCAAALNTKTSAAFWCGDTGGYGLTTANPTDELYIRWL